MRKHLAQKYRWGTKLMTIPVVHSYKYRDSALIVISGGLPKSAVT